MNQSVLYDSGPRNAPARPELQNVTVIIPTKNRPDDLAVAVRSLFTQSVLPTELIIVDQSDGLESRECVQSLYKSLHDIQRQLRLQYIYDPSISGGAVARNVAMDSANGDYWVFLDDDVILEPEFLAELLAVYRNSPEVAGVSGIITNYPLPPRRSRVFRSIFKLGPFRDQRQDIYWHADELRDSDPIRIDRMGGGLMSFRASEVRDFRFDSRLRNTSEGEDVEFCYQLGPEVKLVITPRARLEHKKTPKARPPEHWLRPEVRGLSYLYRRLWKGGITSRLCYTWMITGYCLIALAACFKSRTLIPLSDLMAGLRDCRHAEPLKRKSV